MSDLNWLTDEQMARLQPYFPKSHRQAEGRRSAGVERHRFRQSEWVALVRCTKGVRPTQDALPPLEAVG